MAQSWQAVDLAGSGTWQAAIPDLSSNSHMLQQLFGLASWRQA